MPAQRRQRKQQGPSFLEFGDDPEKKYRDDNAEAELDDEMDRWHRKRYGELLDPLPPVPLTPAPQCAHPPTRRAVNTTYVSSEQSEPKAHASATLDHERTEGQPDLQCQENASAAPPSSGDLATALREASQRLDNHLRDLADNETTITTFMGEVWSVGQVREHLRYVIGDHISRQHGRRLAIGYAEQHNAGTAAAAALWSMRLTVLATAIDWPACAARLHAATGVDPASIDREQVFRLLWALFRRPDDRSAEFDARKPIGSLSSTICYARAAGINDSSIMLWYGEEHMKAALADLAAANVALRRAGRDPDTLRPVARTITPPSKQAKRALRLRRIARSFAEALATADSTAWPPQQGEALRAISKSANTLRIAALFTVFGKRRVSVGYAAAHVGGVENHARQALRNLLLAKFIAPITGTWKPGDHLPGRYRPLQLRIPAAAHAEVSGQRKQRLTKANRYNDPTYQANRAKALKRDNGKCVRCGKPASIVDHVRPLTPISDGDEPGTHDLDELQSLCPDCDRAKTTAENRRRAAAQRKQRTG